MEGFVSGLFDDQRNADDAVLGLENAGFRLSDISRVVGSAAAINLVDTLSNAGVPREQAQAFARGMNGTSVAVMVRVDDEGAAHTATNIFREFHAVDIGRHEGAGHDGGWLPHPNRDEPDT